MGKRKPVAVVLLPILLVACVDQRSPGPSSKSQGGESFSYEESGEGQLTVNVGGRRIEIAPPDGYCVDPATIRNEDQALFVMIGNCDGANANEALATLSLGDKALFGKDKFVAMDELAAFIKTDAGRKGAGMGGKAEEVRILETRRADDTLFVLVEDLGERVARPFGQRFWRAFTDLNGCAVIATHGLAGTSKNQDEETLQHLSRIVAAIRTATRASIEKVAASPGSIRASGT